jgi:hypothetical protein
MEYSAQMPTFLGLSNEGELDAGHNSKRRESEK